MPKAVLRKHLLIDPFSYAYGRYLEIKHDIIVTP